MKQIADFLVAPQVREMALSLGVGYAVGVCTCSQWDYERGEWNHRGYVFYTKPSSLQEALGENR